MSVPVGAHGIPAEDWWIFSETARCARCAPLSGQRYELMSDVSNTTLYESDSSGTCHVR